MLKKIKGLPEVYELRYKKPSKILVVGCGGTGGHIIPHLARMIGVIKKSRAEMLDLILADGDIVEEKNLVRQNFITADLGKNKASVMASRYSRVFGFEITAITKDLESKEDISKMTDLYPSLVVGCVDNNASRRVINQWFLEGGDKFWIDSGNEESSGQVICGYTPLYSRYSFSTPTVFDVFPEMENDESSFNSQLSCAARAQSAPQNMQTNVTAATISMNYIQKIIMGEPLKSHGVIFSIDNVFSTILNTKSNLAKTNPNRRKGPEDFYGKM